MTDAISVAPATRLKPSLKPPTAMNPEMSAQMKVIAQREKARFCSRDRRNCPAAAAARTTPIPPQSPPVLRENAAAAQAAANVVIQGLNGEANCLIRAN